MRLKLILGLACFSHFSYGQPGELNDALSITTEPKTKLVLVVSLDQLRRDRVNEDFQGGIGKLMREGRVFTNANLDHGVSSTCPGHAVILTGRAPGPIGIPANSYLDPKTMKEVYCVEDTDPRYTVLGGSEIRSPRPMQATALGDWLKQSNAMSKVFSVGGKDRSTITMAGQNPDGVFWFDKQQGKFTSSGYYMAQLPEYVDTFNGIKSLEDGFLSEIEQTWLHPEGKLRIDDYQGESEQFGRISGHPLGDGEPLEIYTQVYRSPEVDKQSIALAKKIFDAEKLGRGDSTDLLILALSATDTVGHLYGPRSAEAEDVLKQADLELGKFIEHLESELGQGSVVVALTADHGVAELSEYATEKGTNSCPDQGRFTVKPLIMSLAWSVYWRYTWPFDKPTDLVGFGGSGIVLNREYIAEKNLDFDEVLSTLDDVLSEQEIIEAVWTKDEMLNSDSEVARLLRNSFSEGKTADLQLQLKRDCILNFEDTGTTHGSVYSYDRDIPIIFYGADISQGRISSEAHSIDIGPTLADYLQVVTPSDLDGQVLPLK